MTHVDGPAAKEELEEAVERLDIYLDAHHS